MLRVIVILGFLFVFILCVIYGPYILLLLREGIDPIYSYDARFEEPDRLIIKQKPEEAIRGYLNSTHYIFPKEGGDLRFFAQGSKVKLFKVQEVIIRRLPEIARDNEGRIFINDDPHVVALVKVIMYFEDGEMRRFRIKMWAGDRGMLPLVGPGFSLGDWQLESAELVGQ